MKTTLRNACNLIDLCEALNTMSIEERLDEDLSDLPTFGGADIDNTAGIWSWDETDLIVQSSAGFRVISRADFFA